MPRRAPRPRGRPGRRTPLTEDVATRIEAYVASGCYINAAAAAVGVSESTLYRWLARGRGAQAAEERGEKPNPADRPYREFWQSALRARARGEVGAVLLVPQAMRGGQVIRRRTYRDGSVEEEFAPVDGKLALRFLERSFPERWSRQPPADPLTAHTAGGREEGSDAAAVAARVIARAAERRAELEAGVVDGEVVP